jgi:hypothetical protein
MSSGATYCIDWQRGRTPRPFAIASAHPYVIGVCTDLTDHQSWWLYRPPEQGRIIACVPLEGELEPEDEFVAFNGKDTELVAARVVNDEGMISLRLDLLGVSPEFSITGRREWVKVPLPEQEARRGAPEPPDISWVPGDSAVVVNFFSARVVVDRLTGAQRALELPPLRDQDDGADLIVWKHPIRFLTPDTVVFVARSSAWPDTRGARIYTCRLDGSALRRLTPLDDDPAMPRWVFPETGKLAVTWPDEE